MSDTPRTDAAEANQVDTWERERECGWPAFGVDFDFARAIERELNAALARVAELEGELAKLTDPVAIHINMLRGTIATPSRELMEHVWNGEVSFQKLHSADALRARVAELEGGIAKAKSIMLNLDSYYQPCLCPDCTAIRTFCDSVCSPASTAVASAELDAEGEPIMTNEQQPDSIATLDGQLMVTAAHRYCLGRRSYIVSSCIDWLMENWHNFKPNTKDIIMRDTAEALMDELAGDPMDAKAWRYLLLWMEKEHPEGLDRAMRATAHKGKPWPTS